MGPAQPNDSLMPAETRLRRPGRSAVGLLLGILFVLLVPWMAAGQEAVEPDGKPLGVLGPENLRGAIDRFDRLASFYGGVSGRDQSDFARRRWSQLQASYRDIGRRLGDKLAQGQLRIVDLPEGSLRVSSDGVIELDERLDGRWLPSLVRFYRTRGESETDQSELLMPTLVQALSQVTAPKAWPWFDDHVLRAGILGPVGEDEAARAELARYFFLKDRYLTLSMRRVAEGDPFLRHDWARRQMRAFTEVRGLRQGFAARFGAGPAELLRRDWADYVALVDGFAVTRGWLMLDPALRGTQGRQRSGPGAVEQAAGAIVAGRETSILRRRAGQRAPGLSTGGSPAPRLGGVGLAGQVPGPSLESLVREIRTAETRAVLEDRFAAKLQLQGLALRPEPGAGPSETAEFRAFAARLKEAIRQPDPKLEIAKRDAALDAAEKQLAALQVRVRELEPVEQEVSALQERVEELDAAQQAVATLQARVRELDAAEQEVLVLQERVRALDAAEQEVAALQQRVAELAEAEQEVVELQAQVQALDAAEREVAALRLRVDELGEAEEEVALLQQRVQELNVAEQEVAALQQRVQELAVAEEQVAALQERVQALNAAEQEVAALRAQVQALTTAEQEVAALQERVQELDAAELEVLALRDRIRELNAAEQEVAALQLRVQQLDAAEEKVGALQERVQELDSAEQEVAALRQRIEELNAAEQQVSALQQRVGDLGAAQTQVSALQEQVDRLGQALSAREAETAVLQEQLAEARSDPATGIGPAVSRIEERQLYMMAAIGLMLLLTLALWLWRRERTVVVYEQAAAPAQIMPPPLLLKSPAARGRVRRQEARPLPEVIEVAPLADEEAAQGTPDPGAASAGKEAANGHAPGQNGRAAEPDGQESWEKTAAAIQAAALGSEENAAAHPIVRALRKGNLPLFELLFSEMTDLRSPQLQRIVYGGGGEDLAIVCRAVGVDKLLFGAIYLLTDHLRGGDAETDPERLGAIIKMYDRTAPETASKVLSKWQRNWGAEVTADSSLVE